MEPASVHTAPKCTKTNTAFVFTKGCQSGVSLLKGFQVSGKGFGAEDWLELARRELLQEDGPQRLVKHLHELMQSPRQHRKQVQKAQVVEV